MEPAPEPDPEIILWQLDREGISVRTIAEILEVDHGHLCRVLHGDRSGSRQLLQAAADLAATMTAEARRRKPKVIPLIAAATHMFFIRRGIFESEIFTTKPPTNDHEYGRYET